MAEQYERRWRLKTPGDPAAVAALTHDRCPEVVANMLAQRGIVTPEEASAFFRPDLGALHDPFLMADLGKAVERIERALGDGERIMVYGDYDVDGTTSVALVYSFLSKFTGNLIYYIPDRYAEGYGVSFAGIDHAEKEGVGLIITLDCGIKAIEKTDYANSKNIDLIICDHHRPGDMLPNAHAVLDPKRVDCQYPYKELSGCGVGFKLMQGLAQRNGIPFEELEPLLDLLAVSIACDIVPITGENRILAHYGLKRIENSPRPGIKRMFEMAKTKKKPNITDLVFKVGPRINAAGRVEHGSKAVAMLLSHDMDDAGSRGILIDKNNSHRQDLDKAITEQALMMTAAIDPSSRSTVVFDPEWHKGVIGIVASRLIEKFYRPTIVLTASNNEATGSARSVRGFDVYEAIAECADLLDRYGGHKYAAGLTMPLANVEEFKRRFEEVVSRTITPDQLIPEFEVDLEMPITHIDARLLNIVDHMAPFGPRNMKPVFCSRGVKDTGDVRIVGEDHLKLRLYDHQDPGKSIDAIAFRMGHHLPLVESGEPFSVIYTVEWNEWRDRKNMQLMVKDIKPGVKDVLVGAAEMVNVQLT